MVISHNYGPAPGFGRLGRFGWFRSGYVGVTLFFVLSGFLISQRLIAEFMAAGRVNVVAFWGRRARRLLPALALCLALLVANNARTHVRAGETLRALVAAVLYGFNLVGIHRSPTNPLGGDGWGALWSLSVEEQFYIVWPIPLAWLWWKKGARAALITVSVLTAAAAAWTTVLWLRSATFNRLYLATDTRSQSLLLGASLALAWHQFPQLRVTSSAWAHGLVPATLVFLGLGLFGSSANPAASPGWMLGPGLIVISGIAAYIVWASTAADPRSVISRILGSRPAVEIGKRSYGLYLYHEVMSAYFEHLKGGWVLSLTSTFVLAALSYRFIEQPIIAWARRPRTLAPS